MEKIQSHAIKDIWRVREGLLVEVWKYESLGHSLYGKKISVKRVRGCKGLTELKEDCVDSFYKKEYKKGTLLYFNQPVQPITDTKKFRVEIKSSGGSIFDDMNGIRKVLADIEVILESYYL
ncbi:hypothetical protein AB3N02_21635 [Priestia aryabhattai]|uniref:hypothetical protein n=1 Tax=Priestia aryabhattai TaxID=412384 RepID=UPI0039A1ADA0